MIAALLLPLALAATPAPAPPPPVAFPGAAAAKDPTGRFSIEPSPGAAGHRELRLIVLATGAARPLLALPKSAIVYWAPDGNAAAVAVRREPDRSTVLLYASERPGEIDLSSELARTLGPLPEQIANRRVLLEVVRWLDAKRLRLRLSGVGQRDPEGFSELFDYELGGRFKRAVF